ncbi:spore maturation protein [Dehalobacterium formicoaceticum]|uniref:Spore maturation protein n=1 Tax=Dehalobacterium formicoaceticum TaxID=51515 RepID=A0ABT1Y4P5_9FIRM|nr:spore maturation protein [Dehalobacterium formicoaceticum]MCR6545853.1 spore maturation protein [Dehalobacterium formicoaceticum]
MDLLTQISRWAIPVLLFIIPLYAYIKKVNVYEVFVEGAGEGIKIAFRVLPFLVGMLVAISVFRASGAMAALINFLSPLTNLLGIPGEVLPLAVMRPLSGSGALGITAELINQYGPDSFIGRLASTMQGSTDTTFYVLTVYFGSVGVIKYRYAVQVGLIADITSFIASVIICHLYFGT